MGGWLHLKEFEGLAHPVPLTEDTVSQEDDISHSCAVCGKETFYVVGFGSVAFPCCRNHESILIDAILYNKVIKMPFIGLAAVTWSPTKRGEQLERCLSEVNERGWRLVLSQDNNILQWEVVAKNTRLEYGIHTIDQSLVFAICRMIILIHITEENQDEVRRMLKEKEEEDK